MTKQYITSLLLASGVFTALSGSAQSTGPVAHWPMNGNPKDTSGNGHHGTLHNVVLTTGKNGIPNSAYFFSGVGSYISVPYSSAWNVTQYTIGAVVKPTAFNTAVCQGNYIIARGNQSDGRWALSYNDNLYNDCNVTDTSKFLFQNYPGMATFSNNTALQYIPAITTNTWYTVIATYDGSVAKVYVNGVLKSSASYTANMLPNLDSVIIGRESIDPSSTYPFPFIGAVDDIRFYNRVLTTTEITGYTIPVPVTTSSVDPLATPDFVQLSPNPAHDAVELTLSQPAAAGAELRLFDIMGKLLYQAPVAGTALRLDLSLYPAGMYIVRLHSGNSEWAHRIAKQ